MSYDMIIIGCGAAGATAAIYGVRAGKSVLVLEKMPGGMGQIATSHQVDNYTGLPGISGFDLGMKFRKHAKDAGAEILDKAVLSITKSGDTFAVETKSETYEAKVVIYATGAVPKELGIPSEAKFKGRGVSYCANCDGFFYKDKVVAVIGGGDVALDDALYLSDIAQKVYLVHRRAGFRGAASTLQKVLAKENIEVIPYAVVDEILGENKVEGLRLKPSGIEVTEMQDKALTETREIAVDGVFLAIGTTPQTDLIKDLAELQGGYAVAGENCETQTAGLYVAGDIRTKELRQLITAASDGANAATNAANYLNHI